MSEYYVPSGSPATGATGASSPIRSEFTSISAGFDKLPTLNNKADQIVAVNSGGTALTAVNNATARTNLGLGSIATQHANNVAISGGNIVSLTSLTTNNATITGGAISSTSLTNLIAMATNNATITGGAISGVSTLGSNNAAITGGSLTNLTALTTNNATITGGAVSGVSTLGSNNAAITGGTVSGLSALGTNNVAITGGTISGVSVLSTNNVNATGGVVNNIAVNNVTVGGTWAKAGTWTLPAATFNGAITANAGVTLSGSTSGVSSTVNTGVNTALYGVNNDSTAAAPTLRLDNNATSGDSLFAYFTTDGGSLRGSIDFNRGGVQVRYNVTSDGRLKIKHGPAVYDSGWLPAVAASIFDVTWKETGYRVNTFIAQDLHAVEPDAVKKGDAADEIGPDSVIWGVDHSKLVVKLILEVNALRKRVAALEGA